MHNYVYVHTIFYHFYLDLSCIGEHFSEGLKDTFHKIAGAVPELVIRNIALQLPLHVIKTPRIPNTMIFLCYKRSSIPFNRNIWWRIKIGGLDNLCISQIKIACCTEPPNLSTPN